MQEQTISILILGSGGRENAFAWKISQSKLCKKLFIAPGNPGTAQFGENKDIELADFHGIASLVKTENIQLVIVGPEDPLVNGISDFLKNEVPGLIVLGPEALGAQLEGSKDFSKKFMQQYNIPTAKYATFNRDTIADAKAYIKQSELPIVLKADGLAAGKGVLICKNHQEALLELELMLAGGKFGNAGSKVVIESFLDGIEVSVFVLTNGTEYLILPEAKDYKRIGDGDTGLNTGGMGAISPVPFADVNFMTKVKKQIIEPTLNGLKEENIPYFGFIFIGLMKVGDDPFVIEYNCRMGDPETEAVLPRIKTDFVETILNLNEGRVDDFEIIPETASTLVLTSAGYPESYHKGKIITGIDLVKDALIFHSGTKINKNELLTNGGRVIAITALGSSIEEARKTAYKAANTLHFDGMHFRKDIGLDLIN